MCTAATYKTKEHYFGRTFDWLVSYGEKIAITPRNYTLRFRKVQTIESHYAMIGMAVVVEDYPLYYDATNEKGLSMAGLNFPENAHYNEPVDGKDNITPFEFIPWMLSQCKNVREAREKLETINIVNIGFNEQFQLSPLHWIISDREESITVEAVKDGLKVYDNPVGVLTNNPTFDMQLFNLNNYKSLTREMPKDTFAKGMDLKTYSYGMGALGLPGDLSSMSRFVRVAFTKMNSVSGASEEESISQFFHILESVAQTRGCVHAGDGKYEITIYTSCCNTDKGIYYYTTYENSQITGVDMNKADLESVALVTYELVKGQQIMMMN